ncbi:hypothetical protein JYU19_02330 [bacterium AH-315-J21]|nr:hypothetical protein [bacterium AH-315-J21]
MDITLGISPQQSPTTIHDKTQKCQIVGFLCLSDLYIWVLQLNPPQAGLLIKPETVALGLATALFAVVSLTPSGCDLTLSLWRRVGSQFSKSENHDLTQQIGTLSTSPTDWAR